MLTICRGFHLIYLKICHNILLAAMQIARAGAHGVAFHIDFHVGQGTRDVIQVL